MLAEVLDAISERPYGSSPERDQKSSLSEWPIGVPASPLPSPNVRQSILAILTTAVKRLSGDLRDLGGLPASFRDYGSSASAG
jgi:hypothetical protein